MKAVVLVGGLGTRLRPLTETVKKELLPLVDREIIHHTLDRLVRHGVEEAIMSSPYLEDAFAPMIEARAGTPRITWVTETDALDTGGAIVHALGHVGDESFFALNGDILTDLDLSEMARFHRDRAAAITIALHRVEDARAFGLVATEADGRVTEFREKPETAVPGTINAGTYLLDPQALGRWTANRPISIEREIFPGVIEDGRPVFGFQDRAYWKDLGTPDSYLQATFDLLDGRVDGYRYAAPWLDERADVAAGAVLGRHVSVGPDALIGSGADLDDSVVMSRAEVGAGAHLRGSIVGPRSWIGPGATLVGCVVGEGARVAPQVRLADARIGPFGEAPG